MRNLIRNGGMCLAAAAMFAIGSTAKAATVDALLLDINTLDVTTSTTPFGLGYTGDVTLSLGASTTMPEVRTLTNPGTIWVSQTLTGSLLDVNATASFAGGALVGGTMSVVYDNGDATTTTYTADLIPLASSGVGMIASQSSTFGTFTFSADTKNGMFDNTTLGGYDLSAFVANQGGASGLFGNVITFAIDTVNGSADMDVAVLVPLPSSALMGAASLASLGLLRNFRRRRQLA